MNLEDILYSTGNKLLNNFLLKMEDILKYLFQFADNDLKNTLLKVNKQLNKLKYNDFINDDISAHILTNKGYLNIELYN